MQQKEFFFFLIYNESIQKCNHFPMFPSIVTEVNWSRKIWTGQPTGSLTSMGIKIKWNYPLTNAPLSIVKISTERYQIFLEFIWEKIDWTQHQTGSG